MRWNFPRIPQVKNIMDRYHILDRTLDNNVTIIKGFGTPCTLWHNSAILKLGQIDTDETKCYCWDDQNNTLDKKHFLCGGTGVLSGWQKYGYKEIVFSTPSTCTLSSTSIIKTGTRNSKFVLSGTTTSAYILTERFTLTNMIEVDHFLVTEEIQADQNRIEYEYSTDDITWNMLTLEDYDITTIANKQAALSLPVGTEYIRFRITLKKRSSASLSPKFNSFKFRYQNTLSLSVMDDKFPDITIPSFMASKEQESQIVNQGEFGWQTSWPLRWWTLPDSNVKNGDVIKFLKGTYAGRMFEIKNLQEYNYGEDSQVLHRGFESVQIRDNKDYLGIVHYLV